MALVVNTNVSSLVAQRNLLDSKNALDTAMERLSSGKRINSASDDAAGLAIATRMETQIRGLNQAVRNANDGISILQTAEGAMDEITNMLQRMRELSVQSANAANTSSDRDSINAEVAALSDEIDRIATQTRFNDQLVLDGSFSGKGIQVGVKADESIDVSIGNLRSTSLGRQDLANSTSPITSGLAKGTSAVTTVAQLTFSGNDTYSFSLDGVSVSGTVTAGSAANVVDAINDQMTAAGKTHLLAELKNGSVEIRNTLGGNIGITGFASTGNGTANFTVLEGSSVSQNVILNDAAAVTTSNAALGTVSSSKGVLLDIPTVVGDQSFYVNGNLIEVSQGDTADDIRDAMANVLGTANYEFLIATETPAVGGIASGAGVTAPTGATEIAIVAAAGYDINITNFSGNGTPAGEAGKINAIGGNNSAQLIDTSNQFVVEDAGTGNATEVSLSFTDLTAAYDFDVDGVSVTLTASDITGGTVDDKIIAALNADTALSAGGLNSLDGANSVFYEVVQNGNTVTIKKAGDYTGASTAADKNLTIDEFTSTAKAAVVGDAATYELNGVAGTEVSLRDRGYGLFTAGQATPTKMTLEVSGDATYSFNLTNLAGTGQYTTTSISSAVIGGSVADMISQINAISANTGITAEADPNNGSALILTRADGKKIQLDAFTATGNATLRATPNAGQGNSSVLTDDGASVQASAGAAGAAVATVAELELDADKYSFKISDGNSVAVVRATTVTALSTAGTADLLTEINSALRNVASDIVATDSNGTIVFTNDKGGEVEITDFASDGTGQGIFSPSTGQGNGAILDDDSGFASAGKSISEVSVTTVGGASEALEVIDNALQEIDDQRGALGAIQNRLTHTISNLTNISTNTAAAQSRIQDADFAVEAANLAKAQVLQQAGTSMLAQANASPQYVLSLLQ